MCFSLQRRAIFWHPDFKKCSETVSFLAFWLANVLLATAACNFSTSQLQKVVRTWCVLNILTLKCASRYSRVQFFDFATQKWSETVSFLTFWLWNVLLATAACNFLASQQKVVRTRQFLSILTCKCASRHSGVQFFHIPTSKSGPKLVYYFCILTWKCASHHSGVQFFISALSSYLRTRRFSEPTFRPRRPTNRWKNTSIRDLPSILHVDLRSTNFNSRSCIFFHLTLLLFSSLLFSSSSVSASLLCFLNSPYCRKFDF